MFLSLSVTEASLIVIVIIVAIIAILVAIIAYKVVKRSDIISVTPYYTNMKTSEKDIP